MKSMTLYPTINVNTWKQTSSVMRRRQYKEARRIELQLYIHGRWKIFLFLPSSAARLVAVLSGLSPVEEVAAHEIVNGAFVMAKK